MNRKFTGILTVLALSAMSFAQDAAAPAEDAAPVAVRGADATVPAEQAAPAAEAPVEQAALAAPVSAVEEPAVVVAPKAVRNADPSADQTAASARAVEQFRDARNAVLYESVYTREDGVPVRTVYVTQREGKDTVTMDELRGLHPMKLKVGAHGVRERLG